MEIAKLQYMFETRQTTVEYTKHRFNELYIIIEYIQ